MRLRSTALMSVLLLAPMATSGCIDLDALLNQDEASNQGDGGASSTNQEGPWCGGLQYRIEWTEPGLYQAMESQGREEYRTYGDLHLPFEDAALNAGRPEMGLTNVWVTLFNANGSDTEIRLGLSAHQKVTVTPYDETDNGTLRAAFTFFADRTTGANTTQINAWADELIANGPTTPVSIPEDPAPPYYEIVINGPWNLTGLWQTMDPLTEEDWQEHTAERVILERDRAEGGWQFSFQEPHQVTHLVTKLALIVTSSDHAIVEGKYRMSKEELIAGIQEGLDRYGLPRTEVVNGTFKDVGLCDA